MDKLNELLKDNELKPNEKKTKEQIVVDALSGCVSAVGSFFLQVLILYLLWNALMPVIFGLTTVTFWQACGIKLLVGNLFGVIKVK